MFFFNSLQSFMFNNLLCLSLLQFSILFLAHSLHSYYKILLKTPNHFGVTSNARKLNDHSLLLYIHVEGVTFDQCFKCTLIFFIHSNVIVTIFFFIPHHLYQVCCSPLQFSPIIIQFIN